MDTNGKPRSIDDIDVDNEQEFDEFMNHVIAEGDKRMQAQVQEAIRLGIIDEKGNLLKTELREDADRDFGG